MTADEATDKTGTHPRGWAMTDDSQRKTLRDKLRALLTGEFQGLDPGDVANVLSGMASELIQLSEAGVQTISEIEDDGGAWSAQLKKAGDSAFPADQVKRRDFYEIEAVEVERVEALLEQILGLGAVVFQVEEPPPLNAVVDVRLAIPSFHITIESSGRVVHHSPKGTAIDLGKIAAADRAALESIRADLRAADDDPASSANPKFERSDMGVRAAEDSMGPWDSVPIPNVGRRPDRNFRRQIHLTAPDVEVLSATGKEVPESSKEMYGPEPKWFEPSAQPDRLEKIIEERIIDVMLSASQSGLTGMVEVESDRGSFQVLFDNGLVSDLEQRPRNASEELGLMLLRADRISRPQLEMAAAAADETASTVARSLLDLGILDPDSIRKSIAGRLTYLLQRVVSAESGEIRVYGATSLPAGFLPNPPLRVHISAERIIFRHLFEQLRQIPMSEREKMQADAVDAYPEVLFAERDRVARACQDPAHLDLVDTLLRGRRRLLEVFTESGLGHAETFGLVHALHRMGLVRFDRSLHHTIVRERYRENVTVKHLSVHKASYFEVLNVHWSSYTDVVQRAYDELLVQFDPDTVPDHLEEEVHQRVREIRDRVESAYQVLAERETRHAYRKRIMPEYKLAHAIPLFVKQSELAERRHQWPEARDAILRVLEIEPDDKSALGRLERIEAIIDNRLSPDAEDSNF